MYPFHSVGILTLGWNRHVKFPSLSLGVKHGSANGTHCSKAFSLRLTAFLMIPGDVALEARYQNNSESQNPIFSASYRKPGRILPMKPADKVTRQSSLNQDTGIHLALVRAPNCF